MITPVDYYLAEEGKPAFYILIHNKPKPPRDIKAGQILKADTWQEAQNFARCFVSKTDLQYVELSALSPLAGDEAMTTSLAYRRRLNAYEISKEEYWNEKGIIYYTSWVMPALAVKYITEMYNCKIKLST